ncbi:DUF3383 domain-containing protein [Pseudomonas solani]|uniref:DUF3383 domain-containing protein n=1 Tax=Pseudomonas solani TaxID=2731552 RepID=UPI003C2B9ACF
MSLPLSQIVNVQLNVQPVSTPRRDFGQLALFTPEAGNVFIDASTLYISCASQAEVEAAFGSSSQTAIAASAFFAQSPRPKQLLVARWLKSTRNVPAVKAAINGTPLLATLDQLKAVSAGQLSITVDGVRQDVSGLNFSAAADFAAIAALIDAKLTAQAVSCRYDAVANRFILDADVAGAAKAIGFAQDLGATGTYLGGLLRLENGMAQKVAGADALVLSAQTLPQAFAALLDVNAGWYAATVAASLTDDEIEQASAWVLAADKKVFGVTTQNPSHLENVASNPFKRLVDRQSHRTVAVFDKNDPYAVNSWLARALSVNFAANNSTLTMKFKQLPGISADNLTLTEADKCRKLGLNFYTYFDESAMVAEGTVIGGRFFDEVHILDWYVDAVQKEVFATLYRSPGKVPLTDAGVARLLASVRKVCREGVNNGAFAPGVWNGDPFGNLVSGERLDEGFYVWADSVDNLSTSDREQRKAPPIQVALKMAGAVHSVDVLVNFDR